MWAFVRTPVGFCPRGLVSRGFCRMGFCSTFLKFTPKSFSAKQQFKFWRRSVPNMRTGDRRKSAAWQNHCSLKADCSGLLQWFVTKTTPAVLSRPRQRRQCQGGETFENGIAVHVIEMWKQSTAWSWYQFYVRLWRHDRVVDARRSRRRRWWCNKRE